MQVDAKVRGEWREKGKREKVGRRWRRRVVVVVKETDFLHANFDVKQTFGRPAPSSSSSSSTSTNSTSCAFFFLLFFFFLFFFSLYDEKARAQTFA